MLETLTLNSWLVIVNSDINIERCMLHPNKTLTYCALCEISHLKLEDNTFNVKYVGDSSLQLISEFFNNQLISEGHWLGMKLSARLFSFLIFTQQLHS